VLQVPYDQRHVFHDLEAVFLRPAEINNFRIFEGQEAELCQHSKSAESKETIAGADNK
jgi:hypothetical protein